jgi:hypothetical protein
MLESTDASVWRKRSTLDIIGLVERYLLETGLPHIYTRDLSTYFRLNHDQTMAVGRSLYFLWYYDRGRRMGYPFRITGKVKDGLGTRYDVELTRHD